MRFDHKLHEFRRHRALKSLEKSLDNYSPTSLIVHLQVDSYMRKYGSDLELENLIDKYRDKLRSAGEWN